MSNLPTSGNGNRTVAPLEVYQQAMTQFWQVCSQWQTKTFENWSQWFTRPIMSAPDQLSQDILPGWVFGPQVNVYRTSDWGAELRIRGNVAGYGSQLGTIEDCLAVFRKTFHLPEKALTEADVKALRKFDDLVKKVNQAKRPPGSTVLRTATASAPSTAVSSLRRTKPAKARG